MGRFQLELIYCFTFIFHRRPFQHLYVSFLYNIFNGSCGCWLGQETEETSTPTRPVQNVVLTTKGLQERNTNFGWDDGEK